jgi:glycosyltransferase involved in cell wall biosynthesis
MPKPLPISIVVPCRNEAKNLELLLPRTVGIAEELILVDGHSTDNTKELAEKYGAKFVLDNGLGKGDGLRVGITQVTKDVCVFIDADLSHAPETIPELVAPILANECDLVLASRMRGGSDEFIATFMELIRLAGNMGATWLINLRCNLRLSDSQNGYRAARTDLLRMLDLNSKKHTIELEMDMRAARAGARITEIAAHEHERKFGESMLSIRKQALLFLWIYIRECFRKVDKYERG